jgi:hypothetical protein
MNTHEHEAALCIELEQFCKFEGLPLRCAMELIHEDISEGQREWLSDFVLRWDAWEARERTQRELYALAMQQLANSQGSTNGDDAGMETADDESIIGWMDDLRDRVGLEVSNVKATLQAFIGVRSGAVGYADGEAHLKAAA